MSKSYAKYESVPGNYWRNLHCNGCATQCLYRNFKVFSRRGFQDVQEDLFVESDDITKWQYKRRGTVLGIMHELKLLLWEQHTLSCQKNNITQESEVPF